MRKIALTNDMHRQHALMLVQRAPDGWVMTLSEPGRTTEQNAYMWTLLDIISAAKPEGRRWVPEVWKCGFMHLQGFRARFEDGLDGSGPFPVEYRSSRLTKAQMSDLIETIHEYGARHRVQFEKASN